MSTYHTKLEQIRFLCSNQVVTATILNHLGYKVNKNFKFSLRDERTPSASIRTDGLIKDFGGDFCGDILDLLQQHHNLSFIEAVDYVAVCTGVYQ